MKEIKELKISKAEPLPIHVQLMEQLKYHIEAGTWEPGAQLPTVRELASALRINYNTVRLAFQELEHQGYLVTEQGRGTFVSENPPRPPSSRQDTLLDLVDEALVKAQALGVTAEEFARTAYARAKLFTPMASDMRLLFSECNRPDLEYYAKAIEQGTGVRPKGLLVEELRGRDPEFFDQFDLIATTLFHVAEVQEIAGPERTVLGLMVKPSYLDVLAEIAHLPQGTRVGLICATKDNAKNMERALLGVGATHLNLLTAGVDRPDELKKVFAKADQIYVSRLGLRTHKGRWPSDKPVREYVDDLDATALRLLRREIARVRAERARGDERSE